MDRDEIWAAIDAERASLADLLDTLTPAEWTQQSLCDAWTIRDVGAHVGIGPFISVREVFAGFVKARGNFNRAVRDMSITAAKRPTDELVATLRRAVGIRRLAPGQKLKDCLMDVIVHGQDIALPLGKHRPVPLEAAVVSADHLWQMGFPFHARKRLRGLRLIATDADWSAGEGAEVRGTMAALLMLLAGRTATLPQLSGEGVLAM